MSKDEINQFDSTAGNNTDIEGINTSETMMPSNVQDAIRSMMSLLKKQEVGTHSMTSPDINGGTVDGANITVGSGKTLDVSGGTLTLANDQISGDKINGGSISSTFVGNLTGDVTGNTSGTAATVTGAAQTNITSVGALTALDVNGHTTVDVNGEAMYVTTEAAGTNALRVIGSHASYTGNILQPWSVRAANSAFDFIECVGNNGSEVPFRVRGDGALTTIGSVGFPTLNANYKLAVTGGLAVGAAGATVAAGETFVVTDASHVAKITVTGGTAQFGTKSAADLVFMRSNGEAGRFTATGLGLGLSDPSQRLGVSGNIEVRNDDADGYVWWHDPGTGSFSAGIDYSNSSNFVISNAQGLDSPVMTILRSNGSCGIGVTPTIDSSLAGLSIGGKVLHVHDGSGASLKLSDAASGSNRGLGIASVGVESSISNCEAGALRFGTGNTERARIAATGEFSVNNTSTTGMINATASSWSKNALYLRSATTGGGQADFCGIGMETAGTASANIYTDESHNFSITRETGGNFYLKSGSAGISGGTTQLTLTSDGNAGLGTTAPSAFGGTTMQVHHATTYAALLVSSNDHVLQLIASDTHGAQSIGTRSNHDLNLTANDSVKATLNTNGDLIVGGTASTVLNASGSDVGGKFIDVQPGTAVTGGVVVGSTGRGGTTSADYRQGYFLRRSDGWSTSQSGMWKGSHSSGSDINYWERMKIGNSGGGGHIDFEINDDTKMTLSTGGRLGIGTLTGASARLHLLNSASNEQCLYADATHASYANINTLLVVTRAANSAYSFLQTKSSGGSDVEHNLRGDGEAYADQSWNASGADYAEHFEWADGNPVDEDRRGLSVVLDNEKIRLATADDDASQIIGVVSGNPCVVGDAGWNKWRGKYLRDDFGAYDLTEDGDRKLNPEFDEEEEYIPRSDRKEWSAVGLMGKLRVRKGQPIGDRWIKMRDINSNIEEYLVR